MGLTFKYKIGYSQYTPINVRSRGVEGGGLTLSDVNFLKSLGFKVLSRNGKTKAGSGGRSQNNSKSR